MSVSNIEILKRIKDLRELLQDPLQISEHSIYLTQLENLLPKPTKTLYIDADGLIYKAAYSPVITNVVEPITGGTFVGTPVNDNLDLEEMFNNIVKSVVDDCKYHALMGNMVNFKDYVLVYTPSTNFRYDVYKDYKCKRFDKTESDELISLKKIVKPKGVLIDGVEADDIVAYYGRHGNPIASGDKDVIFGVPGNNYMYHKDHLKVYNTTKEDAERFTLLQSIAGDSADDIPGIKGVGMKTKLLPDNATFDDVINIYLSYFTCKYCETMYHKSKLENLDGYSTCDCPKCKKNKLFINSFTKEDAITTRRLVGMDQWKGPRRGLKLFNY